MQERGGGRLRAGGRPARVRRGCLPPDPLDARNDANPAVRSKNLLVKGVRVQSPRRTAGRPWKPRPRTPVRRGWRSSPETETWFDSGTTAEGSSPRVRGRVENREPRHAHVASSP